MDIREILNHCDHTLLAQTATWEEIKAILDDGIKYNVASCCIPPSFVKHAKEYVGDKLSICTVIGFPNGYNTADVKLFETEQALKEGADEIDMVVNIGDVKEHNFEKVTDDRIIGGFIADIDGEVFDLSIASQIEKMQKQISN